MQNWAHIIFSSDVIRPDKKVGLHIVRKLMSETDT